MTALDHVEHTFREEKRELEKLRAERMAKARRYGEIVREAQRLKAEIGVLDKKLKTIREVIYTKLQKMRQISLHMRR